MADPFDLDRFVAAQADGVIERALAELHGGRKTSHWMWFVFPQIAGLGRSSMAQHFALSGRAEATAYRRHPLLGARLSAAVDALLATAGNDPVAVFGPVDALKLQSSMTLFAAVDDDLRFGRVLERFFDGVRDGNTLRRLD